MGSARPRRTHRRPRDLAEAARLHLRDKFLRAKVAVCSACLNLCPVYERTGGHAYGSVYPGPIGVILTPQPS